MSLLSMYSCSGAQITDLLHYFFRGGRGTRSPLCPIKLVSIVQIHTIFFFFFFEHQQ